MPENSAQLLRPVGQKLEELGVEIFTLKVESDALLISGKRKREAPPPEPPKSGFWGLFKGATINPSPSPQPELEDFEIRLTESDIQRLDEQGKARRDENQDTPSDSHSPSQVLRAVGAYVARKGGALVAINKNPQGVVIEYLSSAGQAVREELSPASVYEFWVKMYLKRSDRD